MDERWCGGLCGVWERDDKTACGAWFSAVEIEEPDGEC